MLRLTGGEHRGRLIETPKDLKTRPTQARLRQALFNSLQAALPDARVLDLFAGSGALGFEALSRGAARAVFVESGRVACKLIEKNARALKLEDRVEILEQPVETSRARLERLAPFELALADPPYAGGWETKLLADCPWETWLAPGGFFCVEWGALKSKADALPERAGALLKVREKNYGDSVLTTYERAP